MVTQIIEYDIACKRCKGLRSNGMLMVRFDNPTDKIFNTSRDRLIAECDHFSNTHCNSCGTTGDWIVMKIDLQGDERISKQFILNITESNNRVTSNIQGGEQQFSKTEIALALNVIQQKIGSLLVTDDREVIESRYTSNSQTVIIVDLLTREPFAEVNVLEIENMSYLTILQLINFLEQRLT